MARTSGANAIAGAVCAGLSLAFLHVAVVAADPLGVWRDKDGGTIRVQACGEDLCAVIASMNPPADPATGKAWLDKNNPDSAKRGRPLIGVPVLSNMKASGPRKWTGTLYDPQRGFVLTGNLIEINPDTIRIEGCMLFLCGGEELHRAGR